jgi:hypothetical protein
MLRILKRNPDEIRMDRLAAYMREFAELLGTDNLPVFKGIKTASTGLKARIPEERRPFASARLRLIGSPDSKVWQRAQQLECMLGEDGIAEAQILDERENVVHLFHGAEAVSAQAERVYQEGTVDGTVTGLVGADDTMHLHLRDCIGRDFRLVIRDEDLARQVLAHFRKGTIRATVAGNWTRTDDGWVPEVNRCTLSQFAILDDTPASKVLQEVTTLPNNGWLAMDEPLQAWRELRGLQ